MRPEKEKKRYFLSLDFEYFMTFLYGKINYHGFVGEHDISTWKKTLKKLTKTVKRAIDLNVGTDGFHRERIQLALENLNEALATKGKIDHPEYIMGLLKIIFLLLGEFPDHWHVKNTGRDDYWCFNTKRKLIYTQNNQQKVRLILEASKYPPYCEKHKHNDLHVKLIKFRGDSKSFLDWYKNKYPQIYLKLF